MAEPAVRFELDGYGWSAAVLRSRYLPVIRASGTETAMFRHGAAPEAGRASSDGAEPARVVMSVAGRVAEVPSTASLLTLLPELSHAVRKADLCAALAGTDLHPRTFLVNQGVVEALPGSTGGAAVSFPAGWFYLKASASSYGRDVERVFCSDGTAARVPRGAASAGAREAAWNLDKLLVPLQTEDGAGAEVATAAQGTALAREAGVLQQELVSCDPVSGQKFDLRLWAALAGDGSVWVAPTCIRRVCAGDFAGAFRQEAAARAAAAAAAAAAGTAAVAASIAVTAATAVAAAAAASVAATAAARSTEAADTPAAAPFCPARAPRACFVSNRNVGSGALAGVWASGKDLPPAREHVATPPEAAQCARRALQAVRAAALRAGTPAAPANHIQVCGLDVGICFGDDDASAVAVGASSSHEAEEGEEAEAEAVGWRHLPATHAASRAAAVALGAADWPCKPRGRAVLIECNRGPSLELHDGEGSNPAWCEGFKPLWLRDVSLWAAGRRAAEVAAASAAEAEAGST
ncbi:hypothetical protein FNF29_02240 [Cafeteria roenbergensis]|uniref:ATP-grasp domain-containing protein n=1 Tax=Cafeteria roenbergensis TaxID=33653 RepID=A0A5A8CSA3_CAFRO|nr:hypothetical protein FNF29_02240 [Cafeteria roenbergensis]|eukprot:KAA0154711.1 hypothetical protein FNF29_02240 [Cafeteria roenbergensis]